MINPWLRGRHDDSFTFWGSIVRPPRGPEWSDHPSKCLLVQDGDCVYLATKQHPGKDFQNTEGETTQRDTQSVGEKKKYSTFFLALCLCSGRGVGACPFGNCRTAAAVFLAPLDAGIYPAIGLADWAAAAAGTLIAGLWRRLPLLLARRLQDGAAALWLGCTRVAALFNCIAAWLHQGIDVLPGGSAYFPTHRLKAVCHLRGSVILVRQVKWQVNANLRRGGTRPEDVAGCGEGQVGVSLHG